MAGRPKVYDNSVRMELRLEKRLNDLLIAQAKKEGISKNTLITWVLSQYVARGTNASKQVESKAYIEGPGTSHQLSIGASITP